jgi:hypothetical protein
MNHKKNGNGKKRDRISELDYCIVEFMCSLFKFFRRFFEPLEFRISGGLDISLEQTKCFEEMIVRIRPLNWPDTSYIFVRFKKNRREENFRWKGYEGVIMAPHTFPFSPISFKCECRLNEYSFFDLGSPNPRVNRAVKNRVAQIEHLEALSKK